MRVHNYDTTCKLRNPDHVSNFALRSGRVDARPAIAREDTRERCAVAALTSHDKGHDRSRTAALTQAMPERLNGMGTIITTYFAVCRLQPG